MGGLREGAGRPVRKLGGEMMVAVTRKLVMKEGSSGFLYLF